MDEDHSSVSLSTNIVDIALFEEWVWDNFTLPWGTMMHVLMDPRVPNETKTEHLKAQGISIKAKFVRHLQCASMSTISEDVFFKYWDDWKETLQSRKDLPLETAGSSINALKEIARFHHALLNVLVSFEVQNEDLPLLKPVVQDMVNKLVLQATNVMIFYPNGMGDMPEAPQELTTPVLYHLMLANQYTELGYLARSGIRKQYTQTSGQERPALKIPKYSP